EEDAEEEVQVPTHDDVDQENVVEETADNVTQSTLPLPPSPIGRKSVDIDERIELLDDQEKDAQVKGRQSDTQAEIYNIDLDHTSKVLSMQEDSEVQEVVEVVNAAKLITEVVTTATTQVIPAAAEPVVAAVVEYPKPMKKKDQIAMDAEYARKLQE
nr:hypothetical protein [Tanacetum cinerariifolium]